MDKKKQNINSLLSNVHDKFFREYVSHSEVAKDIIKEYLPNTITELMDFKSLKIHKDSYIDKELKEHFSDIVYTISIADKSSYVYLLFEHKSYIDTMVPLQLLRNMVKLWENCKKQNPKIKKLPVILPLLFYHGKSKWVLGNEFHSIVEKIPGTEKYIPNFMSELFDISHIDDNKIKGDIITQMLFLTMKYIFDPNLPEKLYDIFNLFNKISKKRESGEYLEILLRYLTGAMNNEDKDILKETFFKSIKDGETIMPVIAEEWIKEGEVRGEARGEARGLVRGEVRGIKKGKFEGKIEAADKLLESGFKWDFITKITGITEKEYEEYKNKNK